MSTTDLVEPVERPVVLVVDDHRLVGLGLQTALQLRGYRAVLSACESAEDILDEATESRADVVLLDLELGAAGDGQVLIRPLVGLGCAVVVLTGLSDRMLLAECLEAGAAGVATKAQTIDDLLEQVREAADGGTATSFAERARYLVELDEHRRAERVRIAPFATLSHKECTVLTFILEGRPAEEIATEGCVSLATVRSQIRSILLKLGVNSQLAAAALARRAGWSEVRP